MSVILHLLSCKMSVLTAKKYLFLGMQNSIAQQIEAQRQFFLKEKTKEINFRIQTLKSLQKEIIRQQDAICEALYADFKKPKFETLLAETQFVLAELRSVMYKFEIMGQTGKSPGFTA